MKIKKVLCALMSVAIITSSICCISSHAEWEKVNDEIKYIDENGDYSVGWTKIDGKTYYFNSKGVMKTGWLKTSSGKYYYFKKDGSMMIGTIKINGIKYTFNSNGVWDGNGEEPLANKTTSKNKATIDKTALREEFYELKDQKNEAYEYIQEYTEIYNEAKEKKTLCTKYIKEYETEANNYKKGTRRLIYDGSGNSTYSSAMSSTDKLMYNYYMGYVEEYKEYEKEWNDVMQEADKMKRKWLDVYNSCKNRMAQIKKTLEG